MYAVKKIEVKIKKKDFNLTKILLFYTKKMPKLRIFQCQLKTSAAKLPQNPAIVCHGTLHPFPR